MKKLFTLASAGMILVLSACSSTQQNNLFKNLTAAQCDNQQQTLSQLPLMFVTPAQAANILAGACAALYGTSVAPTPAPGNTSVFGDGAPPPAASVR